VGGGAEVADAGNDDAEDVDPKKHPGVESSTERRKAAARGVIGGGSGIGFPKYDNHNNNQINRDEKGEEEDGRRVTRRRE